VSLVPLSHVFGQFMALFVPPLLGATVSSKLKHPGEILRTIKRERATVVIAVPRMLDLLRSLVEREIDARGWRGWFEKNYSAAESQPFLRRHGVSAASTGCLAIGFGLSFPVARRWAPTPNYFSSGSALPWCRAMG